MVALHNTDSYIELCIDIELKAYQIYSDRCVIKIFNCTFIILENDTNNACFDNLR